MQKIDPFILKITYGKNTGSGFLLRNTSDTERIYVVTARHIFVEGENESVNKATIKIDFSGSTASYQVTDNDTLITGSNNEHEDFAIIILPNTVLSNNIDLRESPIPVTIRRKNKTLCQTCGYPKITQNILKRTLYECQILTDSDYEHDLQIEVSDPVTQQYNADDLVEGFSGSPIFINLDNKVSYLGVFLGYEDTTKRIKAIEISFLNVLLERNGLPLFEIDPAEVDSNILADLQKVKNNSQRVWNRIRDHIGTVHISRPKLEMDLKRIIFEQTLTVIHGKPGIGKSAIAKKVLSGLSSNCSIITLQGEQLDKSSIAEVFTSPEIGIGLELGELLASPELTENKIIFIDSIEKLLETSNAETIIDFFNLIKERKDLRLVLTCRSYAIEQLKIRFLQQFQDFFDFEIPLLNEIELDHICSVYPLLYPLIKNDALKRILQIPFNIDKATLIQNAVSSDTLENEQDFKRIMWEYIIEGKLNEPDINRRKLRGEVFSEIAYKRAEFMVSYVEIDTKDYNIVYALEKDQLIEKDTTLNTRYSASHDIYEDWALTRKIEGYFGNYMINPVVQNFFEAIGSAPAIRRAFRIWISEKLQLVEFNIKDLILSCLADIAIAPHWKDEILIAIMQSPYSREFLYSNKLFLLDKDLYLFKRCALLLRVACQSPNLSYLPLFKPEEKNNIYLSTYLKPYGEGWLNMINFMWDHLTELTEEYKLLMHTVFQWEKSLDTKNLGSEAKSAALILHQYFQFHVEHASQDSKGLLGKEDISAGIQLLFRLAILIPDEIRKMMEDSLAQQDDENYEIKEFWDMFKSIVLSWNYDYTICELFPDLVLKIAQKEWFYYSPDEEEIEQRNSDSPLGYFPRQESTEEQFGLTSDRDYKYSPASAYQTPIWHLLKYSPENTLQFIVKLFNHSVDAFFHSDFMRTGLLGQEVERNIIELEINENLTTEVKGSELLWCIYRGLHNITSPHLLRSVLMALEKWLLEIASEVANDKDKKYPEARKDFRFIFNYLLTHTKSVSVLAVLVSVATSQPELCKKMVKPLLGIRNFYKWDLVRRSREGSNRYMSFDDSKYLKAERAISDKLPHRGEDMETLVRRLSFSSEEEEMYSILDRFYAQNPRDDRWKLALNRMDRRKTKVLESTDTTVVLIPEIDEELLPMIAKVQKSHDELFPIQIGGDWLLKKWNKEKIEDDNYESWRTHFHSISKPPEGNDNVQLFNHPGTLAAVGIRYFFTELSEHEKQWCIKQIFYIAQTEINGSHIQFNLESNGNYSALDPDHVFSVLVDLVEKCEGDQLFKVKELLFASLIIVRNDLHRDSLIESIRENLWTIDRTFAFNCLAGIFEYGKIVELKTRVEYYQPGLLSNTSSFSKKTKLKKILFNLKYKLREIIIGKKVLENRRIQKRELIRQGWIDQYEKGLDYIFSQVVENSLEVNYSRDGNIKFSAYQMLEGLRMIPFDNHDKEVIDYYNFVIDYVLHQISLKDVNRMEKFHFSLQQTFTAHFAKYLLAQPNEIAIVLFRRLTDWILQKDDKENAYSFSDKRFELVENVLKDILSTVYRENVGYSSFWLIWEYVFENFSQISKKFHRLLLLNPGYPSQPSFSLITGKKELYKKVILQLRDVDGTIWLLKGSGYDELMPEGIEWYNELLNEKEMQDPNTIYLTEILAIKTYYDKNLRKKVKEHPRLKASFISILDKLIDKNSSSAFLIREDFITLK